MTMKMPALAAAPAAALAAAPVFAADIGANTSGQDESVVRPGDDACLQNNRLWGWQIINSRTIRITDRTNKQFTVRVASGCVGLTNVIPTIEIRGRTSLSCVQRGDFVRFQEPNLGRLSCVITGVERVPSPPKPAEAAPN